MKIFKRNIDTRGRIIRGLGAITLAGSSALAWPHSRPVAILLALASLFVAFEAARGWCALRACEIRTRL